MFYESVLFDLDGTLLNTNELILQSFNYTFQKVLGMTIAKEQIFSTFGRPLAEVMAEFDAEKADLLLKTYRAYNAQIHDDYITLFDQVEETLAALKALGLKLAVVTSKKTDLAWRGLDYFQLGHYFDTFIGPEDTTEHKPSAAPALEALRRLKTSPQRSIMVGDSPYDILCGQRAGCQTAAVRYSVHDPLELAKAKPTFMLDTLASLLPIITH